MCPSCLGLERRLQHCDSMAEYDGIHSEILSEIVKDVAEQETGESEPIAKSLRANLVFGPFGRVSVVLSVRPCKTSHIPQSSLTQSLGSKRFRRTNK